MVSSRPNRPEDSDGVRCTVLVVEGDAVIGEFIRQSLSTMQLAVRLVSSSEGALRELRTLSRVVLVVDDDLPLVRGLDLVGTVRGERRDVECLLMTRDDSVIALVSRVGVERLECLRKPFQLDELRAAVLRSIERQKNVWRVAAADEQTDSFHFDRKSQELEQRVEALEQRVKAESASPGPAASEERTATVAKPTGLRVLIVDDDPLVRRAMARTFKDHDVATAENGRAATAEIERTKPDIIFSDLRMPEMDGIELSQHVATRWPDLAERIVFVSGTESHIQRAKAEAPRQSVMRKPVSSAELEARMAEVLEAATRRPKRG